MRMKRCRDKITIDLVCSVVTWHIPYTNSNLICVCAYVAFVALHRKERERKRRLQYEMGERKKKQNSH